MKKNIIFLTLLAIFILKVQAQEGMWLLSQLDQLDLNKKGLQIAVSEVYSKDKPAVYNAVVQLGGGTASFVSEEGLLITNHHVAFTALQRISDANSDYLKNGFLAARRKEEMKAPGYQALLLTDMKDVTSEVLAAAKGVTDPSDRAKKITRKIVQMSDAVKKDKDDIQVYIASNFNDRQYIQYVYKIFKDVRIVYAPPMSVGNYGGETDNWMWPRHTGDFSFMRVYVAPDGTGKEYNETNVPYHPRVYLKVAPGFLKDGDFTFVIGYPGQTTRYRSSTSVKWNETINYPFSIMNFREIIELLDENTKNNHDGEIKVASMKKGLANVMKNYEGKVEGMQKTRFYEKKLAFEKEFVVWANSKPETKARYADILNQEKEEYTVLEKTRDRDNIFSIFQGMAGIPLSVAQQAIYFAQQNGKPESERDPGFSEENVKQAMEGLEYTYNNYFDPVEKALMVRALKLAKGLPADQRITGLEYVFSDPSVNMVQFTDDAFRNSKLSDIGYARSLFRMNLKELETTGDPFIRMAFSIDPMATEIQETNQRFAANVTELRKVYLDGLYEWKGTGMYPDANGTMRFTWGKVKGYKPKDAIWYEPFTTLEGMIWKNTGIEPFDAPPALTELYKKRDFGKWTDPAMKDVPVAFLSQCDITGGNSGSPILNSKGELTGVVFDGNYESMISDWQYDLNLQRTISVDIHYVLFITEKLGKAGFLLDEMGVSH
ncbi:MAG: S46 family peptidase [Bacteroidota bacterium]